MKRRFPFLLLLLTVVSSFPSLQAATSQPFTIVIDAGHGGKDPGALGTLVREKDVVLDVALRFGRLVNQRFPTVKIIYTRNTDVFIPLNQRAIIANKANANLFVSIHADYSENKSAKGPTLFTLGPNRSKDNFEIAKRENAVILLEENYEQRYEGFDPNSAESYIMFEFMQDNYMTKSIEFASTLHATFRNAGRPSRGVRQDVFLVLRNTSMPSVLVELGFLTNREEEVFLKSDSGKDQMANSLVNAFSDFKTDYDRKNGAKDTSVRPTDPADSLTDKTPEQTTEKEAEANSPVAASPEISFCIQLLTSPSKLPKNDPHFKGHTLEYYVEKGFYKYTFGKYLDFDSANAKRTTLLEAFPDAFIIAFQQGKRIPVTDARKLTKKTH